MGQGLLRRRRLPEDRPARPRDALGGRALRRGDRADARASGSTSRGSTSATSEVYERIRAAETTGVFQIESRAQMQMLPRSRPENLDDLTVQVALVRPGPIQGGAVHPYLERKRRAARGPRLRRPLRASLARADPLRHARRDRLPGPGDPGGDGAGRLQLRRGGGAAAGDEPQALGRGDARLPRAASSRGRSPTGVELEVAERVFDQIKGFSGFGFPKSHAAAFGLLAYQSTWLRVHYGPEFLCALLNEQPMGFYPPDALVHEAQRRGIEVRGPDVNASAVECTVEARRRAQPCGSALGYVKGLNERDAEVVVAERERGGPTATSASSPRARVPPATGSSGSPGPAPARRSAARAARRRSAREPLWRLGVARGADRASADGEQLALPLAVPARPAPGGADAVGAGHRRLRRLRDVAGRAPARAAPPEPGPSDRHLRGPRADPRRHRVLTSPACSSPASGRRRRRA